MSWKRWKRGLVVATLTGFATALAGLMAGVTWKQAGIILAVCIGKDWLLYIKQHPIESVKDTEILRRTAASLVLAVTCLAFCGCARLVSDQERTETDGTVTRSKLKITTLFDSKSSVGKARASTTDKTQGLTLTDLDQQTSASNAVSLVSEAVGAAVRAAITTPK